MEVLNSVASLHELPELTVAACRQTSDQRRKIILSILRDLIETGEPGRILLAKSTQINVEQSTEATLLYAAVVIIGKDQTANLLAIGFNRQRESFSSISHAQARNGLQHLLDFLHQRLGKSKITFVQAMRELETEDSDLLSCCGYRQLAVLDYLCVSVDSHNFAGKKTALEHDAQAFESFLAFESLSQATQRLESQTRAFKQLLETVDATYEGSLDCPAIAAYRDTTQVIEGYQAAEGYDPRLWFFCYASNEGIVQREPIGCLLLTKHPAGGSLEVTYMGIVPRWRGKGCASVLLRKTWVEASSRGIPHVTLAVDRGNLPALKIYQRHGFQCLLSEVVWGRRIEAEINEKES